MRRERCARWMYEVHVRRVLGSGNDDSVTWLLQGSQGGGMQGLRGVKSFGVWFV